MERDARVAAVAALAEPTRRRLYQHVARSPNPLSRDDVAGATGVPRPTAAFHLDRLVAEGLLDVHYERRSGRTGPGAGRPAKLYRRAEGTVDVSLPERHYDLAGDLLAGALSESSEAGGSPREVLDRRAYERGRELASGAARGRAAVLGVLETHGFEPREEGAVISLVNCPFHALAQAHTELVCGMNLRLLAGMLDAVEAGLAARLAPAPGRCCVVLEPVAATG
ncbi:helix-turn-helix transcriptional regulator [Blastococcus sp. PRF04-17]|uniref:helix-turn-helix transcriptional regulator n=1 Tax=Blastococcus sp. PRF04-17 TaxID=2933797 RepID=UPI001FF0FDB6|nr:helix-turn-helix domain-containing protein [Blastococcus sp. PRF04-17]UOY03053.1 helix-turn-helix domain-containing protein [Blastococcus sp. PRF04-17]